MGNFKRDKLKRNKGFSSMTRRYFSENSAKMVPIKGKLGLRRETKKSTPLISKNINNVVQSLLPVVSVLLVVAIIMFMNPEITGQVTGLQRLVMLDVVTSTSHSERIVLNQVPSAVSLSGYIKGQGDVKVYLDNGLNKILVLDSKNLKGNRNLLRFNNVCEKSCDLNQVTRIFVLRIESTGAVIHINSLSYLPAK